MSRGPYGRNDRLIKEYRHDTYHERGKLPEPTQCTECGAVFFNGRWSWKTVSDPVNRTTCPACRRIADNYPAGHIELRGPFLEEHHQEILNLILNEEKREKSERPLERVINIVGKKEYVLITTTGIHLARRIGQALSNAYSGELSMQYADGDQSIRVEWQR